MVYSSFVKAWLRKYWRDGYVSIESGGLVLSLVLFSILPHVAVETKMIFAAQIYLCVKQLRTVEYLEPIHGLQSASFDKLSHIEHRSMLANLQPSEAIRTLANAISEADYRKDHTWLKRHLMSLWMSWHISCIKLLWVYKLLALKTFVKEII